MARTLTLEVLHMQAAKPELVNSIALAGVCLKTSSGPAHDTLENLKVNCFTNMQEPSIIKQRAGFL